MVRGYIGDEPTMKEVQYEAYRQKVVNALYDLSDNDKLIDKALEEIEKFAYEVSHDNELKEILNKII